VVAPGAAAVSPAVLSSGFIYQQPVQLNELNARVAEPIKFSRRFFDYSKHPIAGNIPTPSASRLSRARPVEHAGGRTDLVSRRELFRALCLKATYGLSARGLASNYTRKPGGEEFPTFEEFWIERPQPARNNLSSTLSWTAERRGRLRIVVTPAAIPWTQVKAAVYCRQNPKVFGIALGAR